jgi:hypothetical protein
MRGKRGNFSYEEINDNYEIDSNNLSNSKINILDEESSENFNFSVGIGDALFVLTKNNYKGEGFNNLLSKMIIIKDNNYISLSGLNELLRFISLEKFNIFCINNELDNDTVNYVRVNKGSDLRFVEMSLERFIVFLNSDKDFWDYNKDSLYILRNGNFLGIKNLFTTINGSQYNVVRGSSQKAHALSPLDIRLSAYIMVMFNFNLKKISYLNYFNEMDKNRYLSYKDVFKKKKN